MPPHCGVGSEYCSCIVCGSRKSSRFSASATMIADLPSGEKYMLYGSSTGMGWPGLPVFGSMGVKLPSVRPSALLATHSVRKSQDGTTCCGLMPTLNRSTTFIVAGSITDTSFDLRFGTYTRANASAAKLLTRPAAASLYKLAGSLTGGMPGTVLTAGAGVCAPLPVAQANVTTANNAKRWRGRSFTDCLEGRSRERRAISTTLYRVTNFIRGFCDDNIDAEPAELGA